MPAIARSVIIFLAPIMVLAALTFERAALANKEASAMLIADAAKAPFASPPSAGVALLEDIYEKLRGAPKLAMKQTQALAYDQAGRDALRIQPTRGGSRAGYGTNVITSAPAITDARAMPLAKSSLMKTAAAPASVPERAKKKEAREADKDLGYEGQMLAARPSLTQYIGATRLPPAAEAKVRGSMANLSKALNDVNEATQSADSFAAAPAAQQNVRSYGTNAGVQVRQKAEAGKRTIAEEPRIVEYSPQNSAAGGAKALYHQNAPFTPPTTQGATNGIISPQGAAVGGSSNSGLVPPPPPMQMQAQAPVSQVAGQPQDEIKPEQPSLFRNFWNAIKPTASLQQVVSDDAESQRIAMLPPRVVNGIPLVRLGVSAAQIQPALGNAVQIKKQKINTWDVWSVSRKNSKESLLQIYLQKGVVEAIRVFDPNYRPGNRRQTRRRFAHRPAAIFTTLLHHRRTGRQPSIREELCLSDQPRQLRVGKDDRQSKSRAASGKHIDLRCRINSLSSRTYASSIAVSSSPVPMLG